MTARRRLAATALAAVLAPAVARAEGLEGRFSIAFQVGTQSEIAGDLMKGSPGELINKPTTIESASYRDVYAPDRRLQALLGYGVGARTEIVARGTYYKAEAAGLAVGTREEDQVFAFFGPYEEVGFEVSLRYYIASTGRLKSYVGPVAGARFLNEVLVSFSVPDAGSAILNVPFNQESTVALFGLDLGFSFDLTRHLFVGIDSSLRYQTAPQSFDWLGGLTTIDDSDGRWSAPVVAFVGVRF